MQILLPPLPLSAFILIQIIDCHPGAKHMKTRKNRRGRVLFALAILLLLIIAPLTYYQFFYTDKEVDSNIFKEEKVFTAHHAEVWAAGFDPLGRFIASGSVDSTVKIWDYSGNIIHNLQHPAGVTSLSFSNDGK